uniref:DNA replication complex GINS protein SLD5 n=1 Tax=Caenorhabditis japonica TaxID=281687 RepID=A0A8R1DQI3_CAEJA
MDENTGENQDFSSILDLNNDDDVITPEEVLRKMTMIWQNEICAPCLLPTEMDLVDILLDQIQGMDDNITRQSNKKALRISVHRVELQRISYITSDYLRCRVRKIEDNPHVAIEEHNKRVEGRLSDLLSPQELTFAEDYAQIEADLYHNTALEIVPAGLRKIQVPTTYHNEDMVYAKVLKDNVEDVSIPDWTDLNAEVVIEMEKNSVHLIAFNSIKQLIEQEDNFLTSPLVGCRDKNGETALHEACLAGKFDCVLSLLKGGSAINAVGKPCRTPLDCVINSSSGAPNRSIVDYLTREGALTYEGLRNTASKVIQRFWKKSKLYREKKK